MPAPPYSSQSTTVEDIGVEEEDGESATGAGDSESFAAVSRAAGEQNSGERELSAPTRTVPGGRRAMPDGKTEMNPFNFGHLAVLLSGIIRSGIVHMPY